MLIWYTVYIYIIITIYNINHSGRSGSTSRLQCRCLQELCAPVLKFVGWKLRFLGRNLTDVKQQQKIFKKKNAEKSMFFFLKCWDFLSFMVMIPTEIAIHLLRWVIRVTQPWSLCGDVCIQNRPKFPCKTTGPQGSVVPIVPIWIFNGQKKGCETPRSVKRPCQLRRLSGRHFWWDSETFWFRPQWWKLRISHLLIVGCRVICTSIRQNDEWIMHVF